MEQANQLLPRDILLRDTFTQAENFLYGLILVTFNFACWVAPPRSEWILGYFLIAGVITFFVVKTHEHTHPFFVTFLWPKFWLYTAPVWFFLLQHIIGLSQQPLELITVKDEELIQFQMPRHGWLPAITKPDHIWLSASAFCGIYLSAIGLFLIPKSRAFFERLMPYLCLSAVLVALFGYIQYGMNVPHPLLTKGTGQYDFFAFFPYDGHWAAFATMWTCACISMALLTTRYDDSPAFIESSGPWYLTGGTLLAASAFVVEAKWPATTLLLTYGIMMMFFSINILTAKRDPHRYIIVSCCGLISTCTFAAAFFRIFQTSDNPLVTQSLHKSAWEMFADRPWFGWGMDSFAHLLPFYGNDLLLTENYERAGSDMLQVLAEIGIIGAIPSLILLAVLIWHYLKARHNIQLTNHIFIGLTAILLLALVDSPFMSPAVFFSFVVLLFLALRWADISRNRADEVDAPRPTLVTPQSLRRIPFVTEAKEDKLK